MIESAAALRLVLFCAVVSAAESGHLPKGVYNVALDAKGRHNLYWSLDYVKEEIKFEVHVRLLTDRWFALGFSDRGSLENADFCLIYPDDYGQLQIADIKTDDKCLIYVDAKQNCKQFASHKTKHMTKFSFSRKFDTCDPDDYVIEDGTTHVVWASGEVFQKGRKLCDQGEDGMVRTHLLKNESPIPPLPPSVWSFSATSPSVHVPTSDTTYWCYLIKLPKALEKKHHLIKSEPVITKGNEGLVHHMEFFHCEVSVKDELPHYSGPCNEKPKLLESCKKVISAWAMGAPAFAYPQDAGLPVGGPEYSQFGMLEVHYNNPSLKSDWVDSSGVKIHFTSVLRKYDAGVIELGLEYIDKMAIPPHQEEFTLSGYCITECTAVALPPEGITIFGSQLHTHLTGIKVETRHIRHGVERPRLNYDNHYSTHFQEIRHLKGQVQMFPGDALITTCTYSTKERNNITLGGFAITDEMCVNYIYYYPKIDLEVCKSSISDDALGDYFDNLQRWELQKTGSDLPISESYGNIEWNPLRVKVLHNLYEDSTIYMQCNRSNGERFPGNWESMPITAVLSPLKEEARHCSKPWWQNLIDYA